MAKVTPVRVPDFEGGLFTGEKTLAEDNQLTTATNCFYNIDRKLQTRRGIANFGNTVPDAVKRTHDMDTVAGNGTWAGTSDAVTVAADASIKKRGAASITFDITVATSADNFALLTNSTFTAVDISLSKGKLGFWMYVPTGFTTDLTDVRVRIGSASTDYYEFTFAPAVFTATATWLFLSANFTAATTTGVPVDTAIDYLQFRINYGAGYTNKTGVKIDDVVSYSATSTKPMMSLKYFKTNTATPVRYLITNVGTGLYEYDETSSSWTLIKEGLTEGKRFGFMAYKNIMYFGNGTDNYFSYTGTTVTEHTGANTYKGPYLLLANDVGFNMGDPSVPSTLAYTTAAPANLQTFTNALVLDEDDSAGKGTAILNLGPVVIAAKERKIYKVVTASATREQLDYSNGVQSHRAFVRVENEVLLINDSGIYSLAQREATTGSLRSTPLSEDIQSLIDGITNKNISAAIYVEKLKNVYFFADTDSNGVNDSALIFSILTKKWTRWNNMAFNEGVIYEDVNGVLRFLCANALSGQCREIETGTNDTGNEIDTTIETKDFDFDVPETLKTFEMVEVFGFIAANSTMIVNVMVDDEDRTGNVTITGNDYVGTGVTGYTLGTGPLGVSSLGGGTTTATTTTFYAFKKRIPMYATGSRIRIKFRNTLLDSQWILQKVAIYPYPQPVDVYPTADIA